MAFTKLTGGDICDIMNDDCDNLEIETQIKPCLIDRKKVAKTPFAPLKT